MADFQPATNHPAHTLLARAHSPTTSTIIHTTKIIQKPLLLRPTSPPPTTARDRRRNARVQKKAYFLKHQRPKPLSAKQKRERGFTGAAFVKALKEEKVESEVWEKLHTMWVKYMWEVLDLDTRKLGVSGGTGDVAGSVTAQNHGSRIASADFHGAEVEVVRSHCVGRVGIKGIVVKDGKFSFVVVEKGGLVKTIPKERTVFRFEIPLPSPPEGNIYERKHAEESDPGGKPLILELHGSQFENRAPDRANKKFKWKNMDFL